MGRNAVIGLVPNETDALDDAAYAAATTLTRRVGSHLGSAGLDHKQWGSVQRGGNVRRERAGGSK